MAGAFKVGLILSATDKMSRVVDQAVNKSSSKMKVLQKNSSALFNKMLIGGTASAAGIYGMIRAAEESQSAQARLDQVFKSMWGGSKAVAEMSKQQGKYAETLQYQIGVDDEVIKLTQAKLATFKKVSSQSAIMAGIFNRATLAAHDLAAGGFGEATANAVMLGKALQDPMKRAKALIKTGTLTDVDVANVQKIYKTSGLLAAQKEILKAVEKQVGGVAAATAKATDIMKMGFSETAEAIGGAFLPSVGDAKTKTMEMVQSTIEWINNNHKLIQDITKTAAKIFAVVLAIKLVIATVNLIKGIVSTIKLIAVGFRAVKVAIISANTWMKALKISTYAQAVASKIATAAQWLWNIALSANPVGLIIAGITALVATVIYCYKHFEGFRKIVDTVWSSLKIFGQGIATFVISRIKGIISGLGSVGSAIANLFKGNFSAAVADAKKGLVSLSGVNTVIDVANKTSASSSSIQVSGKNPISKSSTAIQNTASSRVNNSNARLNYSPTINLSSGSVADKESFGKMLKAHKNELSIMLKDMEKNKLRLSY